MPMRGPCSVIGCQGRGVHKFPADQQLRKAWLAAIGSEGWIPAPNNGVCCQHFRQRDYPTENCYGKCKIKSHNYLISNYISICLSFNFV